jgi:NAD(P)-dependent dehydrogenase (short-subunit alcohol dehydrogenase family)
MRWAQNSVLIPLAIPKSAASQAMLDAAQASHAARIWVEVETSGIGAATAELFRKAGAEVIIAGTRGNAGDYECCIARRSAGWESPKT